MKNNFNLQLIRESFPILKRRINNKPIVYLDSAAMSLKPKSVIEAVSGYYSKYSANVFRGIYKLSEEATEKYENTRKKVAVFINAETEREVIFVRNTTEAINLVAYSYGRLNIGKNDEVVTTIMEHHSNFLPWQDLVLENAAILKILDIDKNGLLDLSNIEKVVSKKTKLFALVHVSNAIGTINQVKKIIQIVKRINPNCIILVDGAQSVPHLRVDVKDLGCDFLAFSGQKMLGPTGAGVLWGKKEILESMPPFLFGGEMIREVYVNKAVFAEIPHKFEAGTPHIGGVIGLGEAVDYLSYIGMDNVRQHEKELTSYALSKMREIKDLDIYGPMDPEVRGGVVSFNIKGVHAHDVAQFFDSENICVRSGHHCTMPLHTRLKISFSVRATFYLYTTKEEIDKLTDAVLKVKKIFR